MRKILLIFLSILSLFYFNSCSKKYVYYTYEDLSNGLISVEIINLRSREQNSAVEKIQTLKSLSEEEIVQCLYFLSEIEFYQISALSSPITIEGKCIKLNYEMSSLIIAGYGVCEYNQNKENFLAWKIGDTEKIELLIASFLGETTVA